MAGNAHELVHHDANHLCAAGHFDAEGLFDAHAEAVAVLVGGHIVHSVGEVEHLGVGETFAELLYAAVDVAAHDVNLLDGLAVDGGAEAHDAVGGGVLGADVDYIVFFLEDFVVLSGDVAVLVFDEGVCVVLVLFVVEAYGVELRVGVVVLAERGSYPVVAEEEAAHVGVADELDSVEVVYFAFLEIRDFPDVAYGVEAWLLAVGSLDAYADHLPVAVGGGEIVEAAECLGPVHADYGGEQVEAVLVVQGEGEGVPFGVRHLYQ